MGRPRSRVLDDLRLTLQSFPEIDLAVVFGSRARGESGARSDLDVGVLLTGADARRRTEIAASLARAFGADVDLVLLDQAPPLLRFEIARDGELLLERRPYLFADSKARAMLDWWDWAPTARMLSEAAGRRLRKAVARGPA